MCKSMMCDGIYNWMYGLHGDDTGLVDYCSLFIVLVQKPKRE